MRYSTVNPVANYQSKDQSKAITNLVYRKLSENPVETLQEAFDISTSKSN
jgi:hypothetical protein